jgi:hypothetical protein
MMLNRDTIWNFAQNKPSLIVKDLQGYAPPNVIYRSLLQRGVFKWLAVRRDIIKLKEKWKARLRYIHGAWRVASGYEKAYLKGYRAALEDCRKEVSALCHSDRWRAPDFDSRANRWLEDFTGD